MARKARLNFLARRQLPQFLRSLRETAPAVWPKHLVAARQIVHAELELPDAYVQEVIQKSVSAAHNWVVAQDRLCRELAELAARNEIRRLCVRISNCLKPVRASAILRKRVNEIVFSLLQSSVIDLEVIEEIFDALLAALQNFPYDKVAKTARKAIRRLRKIGYSSLGPARGVAEKAINAWVRSAKQKTSAQDFFAVLDQGLRSKNDADGKIKIHALTVAYVATLAGVWRQSGLKPSSGSSAFNADYRTKFHRFTNHVLTAMAEPGALHLDGSAEFVRKLDLQRAYDRLPAKMKLVANAEPRRADREWLVSDDHIKKALRT